MNRKHALSLALSLSLGLSAGVAAATEMPTEPVTATPQAGRLGGASLQAATLRTGLLPTRIASLAAPSASELLTLKQRRQDQVKHGQPLQVGFARAVPKPVVDLTALDWQSTRDGQRIATLELSSTAAVTVRAALQLQGSGSQPGDPAAVTLRFAGSDGRVFEQSGADFAGSEPGWSPAVDGDQLTIEIVLPAGAHPQDYRLRVPQLSHLDIRPTASETDIRIAIGESDSCENDVVCRASPSTGFSNATKAVARMLFTSGGSSYLCTGTLLNNSNSPKRYLFWTAAHCVSTSTVANTLQTYWFYDAASCNGSTVSSSATTLSGGAYLRHANTTRDTSLLELKSAPPSGAYYAGWTSSAIGATGTAIEGIHHPAGDVKKYSLGSVTGLSTSIDGKSALYRVVWSDGVTEGGSSGSGLFTVSSSGDYQLRGGLYGGYSYCSAPSDPDYYSRLADVYSSISTYLSP